MSGYLIQLYKLVSERYKTQIHSRKSKRLERHGCRTTVVLPCIKMRHLKFTPALCILITASFLTACGGGDRYALREQGIEAYRSGDYLSAIDAFNEALTASDGQVSKLQYDILKYRGECEIRVGDYTAAKESYTALYELCKDDADSAETERIYNELAALDKLSAARKLIEQGSYKKAYDLLSAYAAVDGTVTGGVALYNKAVCAEYLGDFTEAYELFTQYTEQYPDDEAARKEAEFCRTRK